MFAGGFFLHTQEFRQNVTPGALKTFVRMVDLVQRCGVPLDVTAPVHPTQGECAVEVGV